MYRLFVYGEGYYADELRYSERVFFAEYRNRKNLYILVEELLTDSLFFSYTAMLEALCKEFSAFSSMYLERQTKFVAACIEKILAIYKRNTLYSRITIVGHSQGGIIARYLVASKLIDPDSVNVIYELAAPILKPATTIDRAMVKMYGVINDFEKENKIVQVSIGGGFNDLQVNQHLNNFPLNLSLQISTVASSLPHVWATTDHLCIVWCNQLVRLIVRSIFNIYLDTKTFASKNDISRILSYHFVNNDGLNDFLVAKSTGDESRKINLSNAVELSDSRFVYVDVTSESKLNRLCRNRSIILRTSILRRSNLLAFCNKNGDSCRSLEHVDFYVLPDHSKVYFLPLVWDGQCLFIDFAGTFAQNDYLLISNESSIQNMEITMGNLMYWEFSTTLNASRSPYVKLTLRNFNSAVQLYRCNIVPLDCQAGYSRRIIASAAFTTAGFNEQNLYGTFKHPRNKTDFMYLMLTASLSNNHFQPKLHLFLNPSCSYRLELSSSPFLSILQVLRRYYENILIVCVQISFLCHFYKNFTSNYMQSLTLVVILMMVSLRRIDFALEFSAVVILSSFVNVVVYIFVRCTTFAVSLMPLKLIGFTTLLFLCAIFSGSFGFIILYLLCASNESVGRLNGKTSSFLITSLFWLCILCFPTFLVRIITLRSSLFYFFYDWSFAALVISSISALIGNLSLRYFSATYWLLWTSLFYYLCYVEYLYDLITVLGVAAGLLFSANGHNQKNSLYQLVPNMNDKYNAANAVNTDQTVDCSCGLNAFGSLPISDCEICQLESGCFIYTDRLELAGHNSGCFSRCLCPLNPALHGACYPNFYAPFYCDPKPEFFGHPFFNTCCYYGREFIENSPANYCFGGGDDCNDRVFRPSSADDTENTSTDVENVEGTVSDFEATNQIMGGDMTKEMGIEDFALEDVLLASIKVNDATATFLKAVEEVTQQTKRSQLKKLIDDRRLAAETKPFV